MSWASLANNQWVSYTDIQGGLFTLRPGESHVTSNQWMTKSNALAKYYVHEGSMTSLSSNQWITKSDLVATAKYTLYDLNNGYSGESYLVYVIDNTNGQTVLSYYHRGNTADTFNFELIDDGGTFNVYVQWLPSGYCSTDHYTYMSTHPIYNPCVESTMPAWLSMSAYSYITSGQIVSSSNQIVTYGPITKSPLGRDVTLGFDDPALH